MFMFFFLTLKNMDSINNSLDKLNKNDTYDTTTELQNSYIQQQQNSTQESYDVTTYSQQIIDSLKARIEELETDSIIKNQEIRKQSSEIQQMRKEFNDFKDNFTFLYE